MVTTQCNFQIGVIIYLADNSRLQAIQVQHEATIAHLQSELKAVKLECSQAKQEHGETQVNLMVVTSQACNPYHDLIDKTVG